MTSKLSLDNLFRRLGVFYVPFIFLATRGFAFVVGSGCIYYVILTMGLSQKQGDAFVVSASCGTLFTAVVTFWIALRESRRLRKVVGELLNDRKVSRRRLDLALKNAVSLPGRLVKLESMIDPFLSILPICVAVKLWASAPAPILAQISIAGFLGLSCIILASFFFNERCLIPVINELLAKGAVFDLEGIPKSTLKQRMNISFGITIAVTAIMIGGLAIQSSVMIANHPASVSSAVRDLGRQTIILTFAALCIGLSFSSVISGSISSRTKTLVSIMQRVQQGDLTLRANPTGTDEIDTLARQFNTMVEELDQQDREMKLINTHLEDLVEKRTDELRDSLNQLRELDRMKTEFFSNVSHELRTPLMMILSPLAQAMKDQAMPAKQKNLLYVADINAQRLLKEINQLLEFSALEAGHVELSLTRFSLSELIRHLTEASAPLANLREVELACAEDLPEFELTADEDKLETVLVNLISNAIKFTPPNGRVTVNLELANGGERCRLTVSDSGIGISARDQKRLFSRFTQLDGSASRAYSGTGLGLALSRELVELHGGQIGVDSEVGAGSSFWFEVPVQQAGFVRDRQDSATRHDILLSNRFADLVEIQPMDEEPAIPLESDAPTILLADDNSEVRQILRQILLPHFRIVTAQDGLEGLQAVQEHQPDLVISDVMMPRLDGTQFCQRMKANHSTAHVPFILLTARARSSMRISGLDCGADDYITKPFREDELLARIRSLLRLRQLHRDLEQQNQELERTLAERNRLQEQLIRSEKMSSLGQLVAGLAHEINNSINVVHNGLPALTTRIEQIETAILNSKQEDSRITKSFQTIRRLTGAISEGTTRTAQIVKDMKMFSHPGSTKRVEVNLEESIGRCLNLLQLHHHPNVTVTCDLHGLPTLLGYYSQLDQVFVNILGNALDAIEHHGSIEIRGTVHENEVTVSIRDDGPGMDEITVRKIFDPFFTTKDPGKGTGLGLSLSDRIMEQVGGHLDCESEPGVGTEFRIVMPIITEAEVESKAELVVR